jgi:hypothetical protein
MAQDEDLVLISKDHPRLHKHKYYKKDRQIHDLPSPSGDLWWERLGMSLLNIFVLFFFIVYDKLKSLVRAKMRPPSLRRFFRRFFRPSFHFPPPSSPILPTLCLLPIIFRLPIRLFQLPILLFR